MFYRKVYPRSIKTIFQFPFLIFFGFFASILGFSELKAIFNIGESTPDFISLTTTYWTEILILLSYNSFTWSQLPDILALIGIFILFSILIILAVASQGALIKASAENKKTKQTNFLNYLSVGVEKFWPLLGLNVINTLVGYFFIILVIHPLVYFLVTSNTFLVNLLLSILIFFIIVPLIIIISFVIRYGAAYIVLKNEKMPEAFLLSWRLFRINWLITLENAFVLTIITVFYFLIITALVALTFVPFIIFGLIIDLGSAFFGLILFLATLLSLLVLLLGTAFYFAFYNIVWANIWENLVSPAKSYSKVHRLGHKHLPGLNR